jgi:hypothetical protein
VPNDREGISKCGTLDAGPSRFPNGLPNTSSKRPTRFSRRARWKGPSNEAPSRGHVAPGGQRPRRRSRTCDSACVGRAVAIPNDGRRGDVARTVAVSGCRSAGSGPTTRTTGFSPRSGSVRGLSPTSSIAAGGDHRRRVVLVAVLKLDPIEGAPWIVLNSLNQPDSVVLATTVPLGRIVPTFLAAIRSHHNVRQPFTGLSTTGLTVFPSSLTDLQVASSGVGASGSSRISSLPSWPLSRAISRSSAGSSDRGCYRRAGPTNPRDFARSTDTKPKPGRTTYDLRRGPGGHRQAAGVRGVSGVGAPPTPPTPVRRRGGLGGR